MEDEAEEPQTTDEAAESAPEATEYTLPDGIPDPDNPPDWETDPHVLPPEELEYPTFEFESGEVSTEHGFDLSRELDRATMQSWLESLAGGLISHDVAVEGENLRAIFGIAPEGVEASFQPDRDHSGTLSVTFDIRATVMRYEDVDARPVGARGNCGFIPFAMLTGECDPADVRCYNWIDDPTQNLDRDES